MRFMPLHFLACFLGIAFSAGCSDGRLPTYPVSGHVTFENGDPVPFGIVEFQSMEHPLNARGEIAPDGSFQLGTYEENDGAIAGKHRAAISQLLMADSDPEIRHEHGDFVAQRYASYETSGLEFVMEPDQDNSFSIVVTRRVEQSGGS